MIAQQREGLILFSFLAQINEAFLSTKQLKVYILQFDHYALIYLCHTSARPD